MTLRSHDFKFMRLPPEDFHGGEQIGERAQHLFTFPFRLLNHLRIEAHARHLHEGRAVCAEEIDLADQAFFDNLQSLG